MISEVQNISIHTEVDKLIDDNKTRIIDKVEPNNATNVKLGWFIFNNLRSWNKYIINTSNNTQHKQMTLKLINNTFKSCDNSSNRGEGESSGGVEDDLVLNVSS